MVDTFGQQLPHYIPALRRYARVLLGNSPDAEDLVQETLCQALRKQHVWDSVRNIRAYLFTMLYNLHLDRIGKAARQGPQTPVESVEWQLQCPAEQPGQMSLRDLERNIRELPAEQRQVVIMIGVHGLSYKEVSETLGIPIGTVMSRLSRGREALRIGMEGESHDDLRMAR